MKKVVVCCLAASIMIAALATSVAAASKYKFIDLGVLSGDGCSQAYGINNSGQVVGFSSVYDQEFDRYQDHGFVWDATNGMRTIKSLSTYGSAGNAESQAFAINNTGQFTGNSVTQNGFVHGCTWNTTTRQINRELAGLSEPRPGYSGGGLAYGINSSGQVAGSSYDSASHIHACKWDANGNAHDLGMLPAGYPGHSSASDINDYGVVVGESQYDPRLICRHATIWDAAGNASDLGALGGYWSYAYGINNAGQVVGQSNYVEDDAGSFHACFWDSDGRIFDIGTFGGLMSTARDININGQVAGSARDAFGNDHAFVWDRTGGLFDLGTPLAGMQSWAYGINDLGQVVGTAIDADGNNHAILWTPITTPEPSSIFALMSALVGVGGVAWRKRRQ